MMPDERFLDCIHCGLCLSSCPTYLLTGNELESPRGRIFTLRALDEGRITPTDDTLLHLEQCLLCRACETACPSGVEFGPLMTEGRASLHLDKRAPLLIRILARYFLPKGLLRSVFFMAIRWYCGGPVQKIVRAAKLLTFSKRLAALDSLLPQEKIESKRVTVQQEDKERKTVILLRGCIAQAVAPSIEEAAVKVLEHLGYAVLFEVNETCCGAIHEHLGDKERAKALAKENILAFERSEDEIISTAAGCGAMLKNYPGLFEPSDEFYPKAQAFSNRVRDFSEFIDNKEVKCFSMNETLAVQVPCHIAHAQHCSASLMNAARRISGRVLQPDDDQLCCGSAGVYNILFPEIGNELGARKTQAIMRTNATTVVTANIGCLMQIRKHLATSGSHVRVQHIAEALADAL